MLVTLLPLHVRHSGLAKVAVGPGAPVADLLPAAYLSPHRTMIRWMAWRHMVSGSALGPAWLTPSVTTPSA
jgi:hypothetical protein